MLRLEHIRADIEQLNHHAVKSRQENAQRIEDALRWLAQAPASALLRERLHTYAHTTSTWQGALPMADGPLTQRFAASRLPPKDTTVVAVDGSQIYPDRHAAVLYYLIQVGGITFRYNGQAPTQQGQAKLCFRDHEIYDEEGQIVSARHIGLQRTLAEMDYLAESVENARAQGASQPILALLDGPLLWPPRIHRREARAALRRYLRSMRRIQQAGGIPVGFVERPSGRGLVTLLWTAQQMLEARSPLETNAALEHLEKVPWPTLRDHHLMRHLLAPGERGIWLKRITPTNLTFAEAADATEAAGATKAAGALGQGQAIWHCYLNLSEEAAHPVIARIEVPAWAARNERWSALLHTVIQHQAHLLQGHPYVLARAHEVALVTTQDKAALDALLQRTLWQAGIPASTSEKARQKRSLRQHA
jgi:hypothetical protein